MNHLDKYTAYIASPAWKALRTARLAIDLFRCRGCNSSDNLEVHHREYREPLDSQTVDDLTTLCGICHEAITSSMRRRRYEQREIIPLDVIKTTPQHQENSVLLGQEELAPRDVERRLPRGVTIWYGDHSNVSSPTIQGNWRSAAADALRGTRGPHQSYCQRDEKDQQEARKN